jgi:hypothetical protein
MGRTELTVFELWKPASLRPEKAYRRHMLTLDRTAIVVRPGQPFLEWLHRADPKSSELSSEDLPREPTVYLLP